MFGLLQIKASKFNDKATKELCKKMVVIPYDVKYEMLKKYVNKCRELHAIAFL